MGKPLFDLSGHHKGYMICPNWSCLTLKSEETGTIHLALDDDFSHITMRISTWFKFVVGINNDLLLSAVTEEVEFDGRWSDRIGAGRWNIFKSSGWKDTRKIRGRVRLTVTLSPKPCILYNPLFNKS